MLWGTDEWNYWWGFKNELQQILSPTLSKSDVQIDTSQQIE